MISDASFNATPISSDEIDTYDNISSTSIIDSTFISKLKTYVNTNFADNNVFLFNNFEDLFRFMHGGAFYDIFSSSCIHLRAGGFWKENEDPSRDEFNNIGCILNDYRSWLPLYYWKNDSTCYHVDLIPHILKYYPTASYTNEHFNYPINSNVTFSATDSFNLNLTPKTSLGFSFANVFDQSMNNSSKTGDLLSSFVGAKVYLDDILINFAKQRGWNMYNIQYSNYSWTCDTTKVQNNITLQALVIYIYISLFPKLLLMNSEDESIPINYPLWVTPIITSENDEHGILSMKMLDTYSYYHYVDFNVNGNGYRVTFPIYIIDYDMMSVPFFEQSGSGGGGGAPQFFDDGETISRIITVRYYTFKIKSFTNTTIPFNDIDFNTILNNSCFHNNVFLYQDQEYYKTHPEYEWKLNYSKFNIMGKSIFENDESVIWGDGPNCYSTNIYNTYIHSIICYPNINADGVAEGYLVLASCYNEIYPYTVIAQKLWFDDFGDYDKRVEILEDHGFLSGNPEPHGWPDYINYLCGLSDSSLNDYANGYEFTGTTITIGGLGAPYYLWEYMGSDGAPPYLITNTVNYFYLYYHSLEYNKYSAYCPYVALLNDNNGNIYKTNIGNTLHNNYEGNTLIKVKAATEHIYTADHNEILNSDWPDMHSCDNNSNYEEQYLTFTALTQGTVSFVYACAQSGSSYYYISTSVRTNIAYSIDNGHNWSTLTNIGSFKNQPLTTPTLQPGQKVIWKGIANSNSALGPGYSFGCYFTSTCYVDVSGNPLSIVYGDNFEGISDISSKPQLLPYIFKNHTKLINANNLKLVATGLSNYCYYQMFNGCTSLVTIPELPATTLTQHCYNQMFQGCTSLISVTKDYLPATTLAQSCYLSMFDSCTSLITMPILPAMTLAQSCYEKMFNGCTSLEYARDLPATTLAQRCYYQMFQGCTSLTNSSGLTILPAETLQTHCYHGMFKGCTSLTHAPGLPALTLVSYCYQEMFNGCSSLTYISALFTTTPSTATTQNWVSGVAAQGTFIKNVDAAWNVTGVNGVPTGWSIETNSVCPPWIPGDDEDW